MTSASVRDTVYSGSARGDRDARLDQLVNDRIALSIDNRDLHDLVAFAEAGRFGIQHVKVARHEVLRPLNRLPPM